MFKHTEVPDDLLLDLYKHLQVEPTQLSREEAEEHCNERCRLRFQVRLLVEPLLYEELFKVEGWVDRAKDLIKERQPIAAIKHCREVTGASLKTAKLAIDHLLTEMWRQDEYF